MLVILITFYCTCKAAQDSKLCQCWWTTLTDFTSRSWLKSLYHTWLHWLHGTNDSRVNKIWNLWIYADTASSSSMEADLWEGREAICWAQCTHLHPLQDASHCSRWYSWWCRSRQSSEHPSKLGLKCWIDLPPEIKPKLFDNIVYFSYPEIWKCDKGQRSNNDSGSDF